MHIIPGSSPRIRIAVAICTFKRNEALQLLLSKLTACAERIHNRAAVGVVVVDDTPDGLAESVTQNFAETFELGLVYTISGRQNISLARNLALEEALRISDWIAMTDDDCEPDPDWLKEFLDVQERTGAEAVTGALRRRAPEHAPSWLTEQPFMDVGIHTVGDGEPASTAATNCSMISAQWLSDHPEIRFDPALGTLGGEDTVFYRSARERGLKIHFSSRGFVYENQPSARLTYRYQLKRFLWEGNSSYVTCVRQGVPPWRMFVHGGASLARAGRRPLVRLIKGQSPQWRFALAQGVHALGTMIGSAGVKIAHH